MGSYDCYCALCSGPLGIGSVAFGSRKAKALKKRQRRVEVQKRRLAGEEVHEDKIEYDHDEEMEDAPAEMEDGEVAKKAIIDGSSDEDDHDYESSSPSSSLSEDSEFWEDVDTDIQTGSIQDVNVPPSEPDSEHDDTWSQASDLSIPESFNPYHTVDETDSMYSYDEKHTYDPTILNPEDVKWTDRCRCLAFNAAALGVTKAFISGCGRYEDYGDFKVIKSGKDANDTGEDRHNCFYSYDPNESPAFPFHEACYKILARNLGYADVKSVDKDILYKVLKQSVQDYGRNLDLDYGVINGTEQGWECLPGEEYSVCDPGPRLDFEEMLHGMMAARHFDRAPMPLDLTLRVQNDPLTVLPYDILHGIFNHLSTPDAISLMNASSYVLASTRDAAFWKHMLRHRISPWFWEIESLLTDTILPPTFCHKALFLWLHRKSLPDFGIKGPFMGIANRRRIWSVCQQLAPLYKERISPNEHIEPEDEDAKLILDSAVSLHMPLVLYPQPKETQTVFAQFIRSWSEINDSCYFDTYWNANHMLVGIAVTFNSIQRVFGSNNGYKGQSLYIPPGDWIQSITMFISDFDINKERQSRHQHATDVDAGIQGMNVALISGKTKDVRSRWQAINRRSFIVLSNMSLIGLTGEIAASGVISRIGLLQAPRPDTNTRLTSPSYTPAERMLWSLNAASLPYSRTACKPIWAHPNYDLHTFNTSEHEAIIPSDLLPHQILLWAESPSQYQFLKRISCFKVVSGTARTGQKSWEIPDIVGIWPGKTHKHGIAAHIGTGGPVHAQHPNFQDCGDASELDTFQRFNRFEEANMSHFEIDGQGGEVVTEVHVSGDTKALKLVTNWGRECYWGEEERGGAWRIKRAEDGELIMGLSCCFGRLGGWSRGAKTYSHWKLSSVGVVTTRIGEKEETSST